MTLTLDFPQAIVDATPSAVPPAGIQAAPSTKFVVLPESQMSAEPQTPPPAIRPSTPDTDMPVVDPLLFVHVTAHADLEQLRIASEHRLRILTTTEPDEDGVMRGFGLDPSHPDVARLAGITEAMRRLEHDAEIGMRKAFRRCAIHAWVKAQVGLGDKQVARLLGVIGDPYWHLAEDRPRTVSELWAYCGLHVLPAGHSRTDDQGMVAGGDQTSDSSRSASDTHMKSAGVAARRRKGQQANWSTEGKTRAYLIATSCIKQERSPYRAVYVARRTHTSSTHPDWTPGHSHNDALRVTSKAVLKALWRAARDLHLAMDVAA